MSTHRCHDDCMYRTYCSNQNDNDNNDDDIPVAAVNALFTARRGGAIIDVTAGRRTCRS